MAAHDRAFWHTCAANPIRGANAPRSGSPVPAAPVQLGRPSAPTMPHPVQTMRGPKDGTGTSSGQRSTASTAPWRQSQQLTERRLHLLFRQRPPADFCDPNSREMYRSFGSQRSFGRDRH